MAGHRRAEESAQANRGATASGGEEGVREQEFEEFMTQRGVWPALGGPSEFAAFMAEEDAKMGVVMKAVGLAK
jgi:tripartite-type tricarboxylate transporter receptor subunit TctC